MTKAEILAAVRNIVNEQSTDAGALLSDTGNLLDFVQDAQEQVVLDLVNTMPDQLLTTEDVTLIANTATYTLTATFWQVWSVQKNVSGDAPGEIRIIDPMDMQYFKYVGQTAEYPPYCYFTGNTITFVPTPSAAKTAYARVYLIRPEAVTLPTNGPAYLPPVTHRLIVYQAAIIAGTAFQASMGGIKELYARRLMSVKQAWAGRFHQEPRFVKESVYYRTTWDDRERAFYDKSNFFDE